MSLLGSACSIAIQKLATRQLLKSSNASQNLGASPKLFNCSAKKRLPAKPNSAAWGTRRWHYPPSGRRRKDRKSVVSGESVSGRVDHGGRGSIKKKKSTQQQEDAQKPQDASKQHT